MFTYTGVQPISYHVMFVSFNINTTGATTGEGTTYRSEHHRFEFLNILLSA